MSAENPRSPIELPELTSARFGLNSAALHVSTSSELTHPQLHLDGEDSAFDHTFTDGCLDVRENSVNNSTVVMRTGNQIRFNGMDVHIGDNIFMSTSGAGPGRKASLLLPEGHPVSYDIDSTDGDVELEGLTARALKVVTQSGYIALMDLQAETVDLSAESKDVEIENTIASGAVTVEVESGSIHVEDSEAPSWDLKTESGNVRVRATRGAVAASSQTGRTRIS